ncbi:MAG: alpha/beta hydrolase [Spirochaetota bacterium]|nr:alpha/beta hydrolase [Spirochaetota bacterium]
MSEDITVIFSHGLESSPQSRKIVYLSEISRSLGLSCQAPDYRFTQDPDRRVQSLLSLCESISGEVILVGSSMGGYVSVVASEIMKPKGLFLMAPAFFLSGYNRQSFKPGSSTVTVIHGWHDELIPPENVFRFSREHQAELHVLDSDHILSDCLEDIGLIYKSFLRKLLSGQCA